MTLLKGVALRGTTVLCSLHQPRPRMLNLLDNVMLLSRGRVVYFGRPEDSESYFSCVGRPFPPEQPHAADAMLTLCCREDGSALPSLFERCGLVENGVYGGVSATAAAVASVFGGVGNGVGGLADGLGTGGGGGGSGMTSRQSLRRDSSYHRNLSAVKDLETQTVGGLGDEEEDDDDDDDDEEGVGWWPWLSHCCGGGGGAGNGAGASRAPTAGFLVQTEALTRRLLLRAVRHPLLLVLHFGGSVVMAACLGTVFQGELDFSLGGAQSRYIHIRAIRTVYMYVCMFVCMFVCMHVCMYV